MILHMQYLIKEQRKKKAAEKARNKVKKQEQSHVDELQDQIDKLVEENVICKDGRNIYITDIEKLKNYIN